MLDLDSVENKDERLKQKKINQNIKYFLITLFIGILVVLCILMECFSEKRSETVEPPTKKMQNTNYNILLNQWNSAVLAADLNRSFELPRDDSKKLIEKLNTLFNKTMSYENFSKHNKCVLRETKKVFIPSLEYANFLKENELQYKINFTNEDSEDDIIQELKKITNSRYIDYKMLEKVAYLSSFQIFFQNNKKRFYNNGFSLHITDFDTYLIAVSRCK